GAAELAPLEALDARALTSVIDDALARAVGRRAAEAAIVRSEAEAREGERFALRVLENLFAFVGVLDVSGTLLAANAAPLSAAGITIDDVRGKKFWDCHWWSWDEGVRAQLRQACARAAAGEVVRYDVSVRMRGDTRMWIDFQIAPLRDDAGRITHLIPSAVDLTARTATEARLRADEAQLRAIADEREVAAGLRDADRRKDELVATLAHELRNPLAAVRVAAELLRRLGAADPRGERAVEIIQRQVAHMARLVDELLDASRISRGTLAVHSKRCDLATIAVQTAEDHRATFEAAGIELSVVPSASPLWVDGDPVRLAQMIGDVLHNACRFTDRGGRTVLRAEACTEPDGRFACVAITDTGVGIDPALLVRLFEPFAQADQGLARTTGGLGLGLARTKGLAELHGGRVAAHSDGVGRGATFRLLVPLSPR
ncbi:HAMP domain-containing histidine kinase, partial [Myxococcota bacterium]|nr:HAMP domain-containing histidine kinase [Myxococcota bacterium]